jgi:hypothetical protein
MNIMMSGAENTTSNVALTLEQYVNGAPKFEDALVKFEVVAYEEDQLSSKKPPIEEYTSPKAIDVEGNNLIIEYSGYDDHPAIEFETLSDEFICRVDTALVTKDNQGVF